MDSQPLILPHALADVAATKLSFLEDGLMGWRLALLAGHLVGGLWWETDRETGHGTHRPWRYDMKRGGGQLMEGQHPEYRSTVEDEYWYPGWPQYQI